MWKYVVINSGDDCRDFLSHSAKGTTWGEHKYIKKETKGGKTRYFYAQQGKTPSVSADRQKELLNNTVDKAQYKMYDAHYKYQLTAKKQYGNEANTDPETVDPRTLSGPSLKAYNDYNEKKKEYVKAYNESQMQKH